MHCNSKTMCGWRSLPDTHHWDDITRQEEPIHGLERECVIFPLAETAEGSPPQPNNQNGHNDSAWWGLCRSPPRLYSRCMEWIKAGLLNHLWGRTLGTLSFKVKTRKGNVCRTPYINSALTSLPVSEVLGSFQNLYAYFLQWILFYFNCFKVFTGGSLHSMTVRGASYGWRVWINEPNNRMLCECSTWQHNRLFLFRLKGIERETDLLRLGPTIGIDPGCNKRCILPGQQE